MLYQRIRIISYHHQIPEKSFFGTSYLTLPPPASFLAFLNFSRAAKRPLLSGFDLLDLPFDRPWSLS